MTSVESSFCQKLRAFINQRIDNNGVPDDLTGALGSFNFCAAIGDRSLQPRCRSSNNHVHYYLH
ncbi:protein of unknown function [Burkholderia multivorans]